jgi:hypothetical protein
MMPDVIANPRNTRSHTPYTGSQTIARIDPIPTMMVVPMR